MLEEEFRARGLVCRTVSRVDVTFLYLWASDGSHDCNRWNGFRNGHSVPEEGCYRMEIKPIYALIDGKIIFWLSDGDKIEARHQILPKEDEGAFLLLGETQPPAKKFEFIVDPGRRRSSLARRHHFSNLPLKEKGFQLR